MAEPIKFAPSVVAAALGAGGNDADANDPALLYHPHRSPHKRLIVKAIGPAGQPFTVSGQVAKVLLALIDAGDAGVTPLVRETWSLRLSDHVRRLKYERGLLIATQWGKHDDGRHARYVLISKVTVVAASRN